LASKLVYTVGDNQSLNVGSVSSVITVQVEDSIGNPVTTGATVNLSTTSTGGSFYSDSDGNNQISSIVISSGQSSANYYYKDTTAGTPILTASSTGLISATTQFTIGSSGSLSASPPLQLSNNVISIPQATGSTNGYLDSADWNTFNNKQNALIIGDLSGTSNQINVSGGTGAIIGSGVTLSLPQNISSSASPLFTGLTIAANATINGTLSASALSAISGWVSLGSIIGWATPGTAPVAGSNAGMILDCWTPSHGDGLGIQSGGIWLKYDTQFDIYRDSGTALTHSLNLDSNGNMTLSAWGSSIYLFTPTGNQVTLAPKDGMGDFPGTLNVSFGLEADDILAKGILWTTSEGIGTGGGAIFMGYNYEAGDMPLIQLQDANHLTLWLKANGSSPAAADWGNLELRNVTSHGFVLIDGSSGSFQGNITGYGYLNNSGSHGYNSGNSGTVSVSLLTYYRIFCGGELDVFSDQRDKEFVETLNSQTALNAIMNLKPLHFVWKPETQKGNNVIAGFFAQEVAESIPESVTVYAGSRYSDEHALNYNVLTTYALSAIQGLAKEVKDLRSQIESFTKAGAS
jgi:hypothetical protein